MSTTVRQSIMNSLMNSIPNIRKTNNFETDLGKNVMVYVRENIKNFPCTMIEMINSVIDSTNESETLNTYLTSIRIISVAKVKEQIEIEDYIQDLKIHLNTTDLDFDTNFFSRVRNLKYVKSFWIDEVKPSFVNESGTGYIGFLLKVKHLEVYE